jgi:hypothetical protein
MSRLVLVLVLVSCASIQLLTGCLVAPDPWLWQKRSRDAATDADGARPDTAKDAPPADKAPLPDLAPDGPVPPVLTCKAPALVGASQPGDMSETALRASGLELVASYGGNRYGAKRAAVDQPFGTWSQVTLLAGGADPTFFLVKGVEYAVVARSHSGAPRTLELCLVQSASCSKLTVKYAATGATGNEVTEDMDGAQVAITAGGALMIHNVGLLGSSDGDVYLASPVDQTDLSKGFTTTRVATMSKPSYKEDDPAISPDGLVVLFGGSTTSNDYDLWYAARATTADPFPAPTQLSSVNSSSDENGPYMAGVTVKGQQVLELYFRSNRGGGARIYRAECGYSY